jgi:hypothetical protein
MEITWLMRAIKKVRKRKWKEENGIHPTLFCLSLEGCGLSTIVSPATRE